jgi:hypothetical protein
VLRDHPRARKPFFLSLLVNSIYLTVALAMHLGGTFAPVPLIDQGLLLLGMPMPPNSGNAIVQTGRWAASTLFQLLGMFPAFLLVTILSTVWWGDIASRAAAVSTEAPAAPEGHDSSLFESLAKNLIRVVALLLFQVQAIVVDAVGKSGFPTFRSLGAIEWTITDLFYPATWFVLWCFALRVISAGMLCAVYAHMAMDTAQAQGRSALERLARADRQLWFLLGAGLPLTAASVLAGDLAGFHVSTAVYGVLYTWLALTAAVVPPPPESTRAPSITLFDSNAKIADSIAASVFPS